MDKRTSLHFLTISDEQKRFVTSSPGCRWLPSPSGAPATLFPRSSRYYKMLNVSIFLRRSLAILRWKALMVSKQSKMVYSILKYKIQNGLQQFKMVYSNPQQLTMVYSGLQLLRMVYSNLQQLKMVYSSLLYMTMHHLRQPNIFCMSTNDINWLTICLERSKVAN